jgi:formate hydrogenlyase subunit 4
MAKMLLEIGIGALQGLLLILMAPGLVGLLRKLKTRLQLRQGAGIFQPYRDLLKLIRRPAVRSETTSWIFALTPYILFVTYSLLAFQVPVFHCTTLLSGDLIVILYILGLARFALSLAGLDSGALLSGLGSSREMFLHFLTEIGLMLIIAALIIRWNTINLAAIIAQHSGMLASGIYGSSDTFPFNPELLLLFLSMALLILFESERIPIDNPTTHLELTMAHKAVLLEYAGRDLAIIEWAEMIKLTFLLTLLINLFGPFPPLATLTHGIDWSASIWAWLGYVLKILGVIILMAIWEVSRPKLRLLAVVRPSLWPVVFSVIAIIYTVIATK